MEDTYYANTSGQKVRDIIAKNFDMRMQMVIVTYIMDKGWERIKNITEEEINEMKSSTNLMTDDFCRAIVRTSVKICTECDQINDFLPFVVNY